MLLGVLFCMPLVPYDVPESSAAMLGAALGSLVTVSAAWWLATHKERSARAESVAFIRRELWAFQLELSQAMDAAGHAVDRDRDMLDDAHGRLMAVWSRTEPTLEIIDAMKPVFATVGPHGLVCHWGIRKALSEIDEALRRLSSSGPALFAAEDAGLLKAKAEIALHLSKL